MKKYELISSPRTGLFRVRALTSFGSVKAGDLGGFVESEKNLTQLGLCWVSGNALVYGDALVYGYAQVYGNACIEFRTNIRWALSETPQSVNTTDGYTMTLDSANGMISAGCRHMTFTEAKKHWETTRGSTKLGKERIAQVMFLEHLYAVEVEDRKKSEDNKM